MSDRTTNLEDNIREGIIAELQRQAEIQGGALKVAVEGPTMIRIKGLVNLDELRNGGSHKPRRRAMIDAACGMAACSSPGELMGTRMSL